MEPPATVDAAPPAVSASAPLPTPTPAPAAGDAAPTGHGIATAHHDIPAVSAGELPHPPASHAAAGKAFDPLEALKLGSQRLASLIRAKPAAGAGDSSEPQQQQAAGGEAPVVARIRATAAGLSARAKSSGRSFASVALKTAASSAEGLKRLALGEPLQALCRSECATHPCPQLVLAACTALVSGGGTTSQRIFKHDPPPELVDRLAAAAGSLSLLPHGASPHALAGLLKRFLLGLPEPLLTYRLLPQWVAAGDNPASCAALLSQLPAANAGTLRLLMQVCALIHAEAAVNEMDSLALAGVLAPCVAWKPPKPRQQHTAGDGSGPQLFEGLKRTLSRAVPGAEGGGAAAEGEPGGDAIDDRAAAAAEQLDDAELEAVVTVLEHMIAHHGVVFGGGGGAA